MNAKCFVRLALLAWASLQSFSQSVIDRGPHHQIMQSIITEEGESKTNTYTLLQTGVSYWSEAEQKWEASSDQIEVVEGGARHVRGPLKVNFPATYLDPQNPLRMTLEDGSTLKLRTFGLAVTDRATGDSVIFAQVKNADGLLTQDGTTVVYDDAFTGVNASIRVKVSIGKVEHDIVLHEDVRASDLGMDPANCDLEVFHEILEAPEYATENRTARRASGTPDSDTHIVLPGIRIGRGNAFLVGANEVAVHNGTNSIPVRKEIYTDEQTGKKFLIEGLPLSEAAPHLGTLPRRQAQVDKEKLREQMQAQRAIAATKRRLPIMAAVVEEPTKTTPRKVAGLLRSTSPSRPGFLIDYVTAVTAANIRLAGNTTYYIPGDVFVSSNLTIEGGTVVKYATAGYLAVYGTVTCETDLFLPAIFTAKEDNSVGDQVSASALSGYYGVVYLSIEAGGGTATLSHLRFRYSNCGIYAWDTRIDITDVHAVNCYWGIFPDSVWTINPVAKIRNYLAYDTQFPIGIGQNTSEIVAEHFTVNRANQLIDRNGRTGCSIGITNSLLISITNATSSVTITTNRVYTDTSAVLTNVLAGSNYLYSDAYRDLGVTTLSDEMKALLNKTTTYKPIALTSDFSFNTTLAPQIPFDSESSPDIGVHFAPIDFIFTSLDVASGATLSLTNGVRIAGYGPEILSLTGTGQVIATGKPEQMVVLVPYSAVQEQPIKYITNSFTIINGFNIDFNFVLAGSMATNSSGSYLFPASANDALIKIMNSRIHNVVVDFRNTYGTLYYPEAYVYNNAFVRSEVSAEQGLSNGNPASLDLSFRNNLLYRSLFTLKHYTTTYGVMSLYDNFFDNSTLTLTELASSPLTTAGYNGYSGGTATFGGSSNKVSITATYTNGPLGNFYYTTTGSITNLVDAGSLGADDLYAYPWFFGLYHYTTERAQTKEGTSTVDIGYHYIATNGSTSTTPYDYDSDGVPDYLEDSNGDGSVDSGETDWQDNDDLGLRVYITQPKSNSIIP